MSHPFFRLFSAIKIQCAQALLRCEVAEVDPFASFPTGKSSLNGKYGLTLHPPCPKEEGKKRSKQCAWKKRASVGG